ncbi:hypothetical protein F4818DRAFT_429387, partial [Hypoxylon cercidicola]
MVQNIATVSSLQSALAAAESHPHDIMGLYLSRSSSVREAAMTLFPELRRRLDSDPELIKISVLGVDPGMMATKITTGTPNWLVQLILFTVTQVT